ncbi:MAG: Stk1 family PASTA domain-containing Ser/Thr kinase [Lachnospiraceae bacterium]|nr:Stk1 family PASTA domain-containing Ser/Thr kinase [Lachnospiraceae bacterium]
MIKIGMLIGDRYEILEKIGTGGMSDVYKAKCHKLNRFVAVKVLKQEFSENTNFVSKFRSEAQAAAGLMHPNIVNVYDVGEENDIYYIVMELVEGITLKKYIEKKVSLSVKEAVSIAIQVSMGIEAAHNNHIIHRDIKPQNIIISKDGKVKVTDFGIAKAATSNTITSNVMGSVHYTSPEQARGGYSDAKSDIYSLGITLFEMLTGRVPFNGETTVAIAIKHIQEPMPSPKEFVPDLPISVEQIVLKCTQKSPDRRYQKMGELIEDLKHSLISPDENFVVIDDGEALGQTKIAEAEEEERPRKKAQPSRRESDRDGLRLNDTGRVPSVKNKSAKKKASEKASFNPRMEKLTTLLAVIAAILIGVIILLIVGKSLGIVDLTTFSSEMSEAGAKTEMPDVVGMKLSKAQELLDKANLKYEIKYETSSEYDEDVVMSSNIKAGREVTVGTTVELTVSSGKDGVELPDVEGKTLAEATSILEKEGFKVQVSEVPSETVEKGSVVAQSPIGGSKAPRGTTVTLEVSIGPDPSRISMPLLVGMSEMDATVMITEKGLTVGTIKEVNNDDANMIGLVCAQSYPEGTYLDAGTSIDLEVSIGPDNLTYGFYANVDSPALEDPTYVSGTSTLVVLTTADGKELQRLTTDTFPVVMNITGIKGSSTGILAFQYTVTPQVTVTDPATGVQTVQPGTPETKVITRTVAFTAEGAAN